MSNGVVLLAIMDAALDPGANLRAAGLNAAVAFNDMLIRNRLGWGDLIGQDSRLTKLCGRLGSGYVSEQHAAYDHAVRHIRHRRVTWATLVRLPAVLQSCPVTKPSTPELGTSLVPPPESDWITTIQSLRVRAAWMTVAESARLDALAHCLNGGAAIAADDACWLRDLWWCAELNDPSPLTEPQ